MLGFDPSSFIIVSAVLGILCSFIFFVLCRSFPKDIQGLTEWAWACLIMVIAAFLYTLKNSIPTLFSSFLANLLFTGGLILMYASLRRFDNRTVPHARLLGSLTMMALLLIWPTFIEDDYRIRIVLVSGFSAVLFSLCAMVIFKMTRKSFAERFTQSVFFLIASVSLIRSASAVFQTGVLDPASHASSLQQVLTTFAFFILTLSLGFMLMASRRLQVALEHKASHDGLTGLVRREAFFGSLTKEISHACRNGQPLSLLLMDLDNFKAINDKYGHKGGDRVIVDFSRKVQQILRDCDLVGRYGGEEFIVLLRNTAMGGAHIIAERIRSTLVNVQDDDLPAYTVSIGIATIQGSQPEAEALIDQADQALYIAKRLGKNRIETVLQ